ncbi:MAG: hypothetical protein A4E39_00011 [Methanoregulaceae archaeon PtaB.Bin152]|nr:MAG: hypothetical protein A4E39_00011 [Methanoregulaceae archaeon PtaB.Bin152]
MVPDVRMLRTATLTSCTWCTAASPATTLPSLERVHRMIAYPPVQETTEGSMQAMPESP